MIIHEMGIVVHPQNQKRTHFHTTLLHQPENTTMKTFMNKIYTAALLVAAIFTIAPTTAMEVNQAQNQVYRFEHLPQDVIGNICGYLDAKQINCFASVSRRTYGIWLFAQRSTYEIARENTQRDYRNWSDIPEFTAQRTFWVNDHFIELLARSMNLKAKRGCQLDDKRYETLCDRFENSLLPKNSTVMEYVDYLSCDKWRVGSSIGQLWCSAPDLSPFLTKEGFDNEKSLYLFHTYLYGDKPNIQGLVQDPLYSQIKGGMASFIQAQEVLHPIRLKLNRDKPMWTTWQPLVSIDEIQQLLRLDPGITCRDMINLLEILIQDQNAQGQEKYTGLLENGLGSLMKLVLKSRISTGTFFIGASIDLYRAKASREIFAKFLHFTLLSPAPISKRLSLHREAELLFIELEKFDLVAYHGEQIARLEEIARKEEVARTSWGNIPSSKPTREFRGPHGL